MPPSMPLKALLISNNHTDSASDAYEYTPFINKFGYIELFYGYGNSFSDKLQVRALNQHIQVNIISIKEHHGKRMP